MGRLPRANPDRYGIVRASINRVVAWVIGTSNRSRTRLKQAELEDGCTTHLALIEDAKLLPAGTVWDQYCAQQDVPVAYVWLAAVKRYEREVLAGQKWAGVRCDRSWRRIHPGPDVATDGEVTRAPVLGRDDGGGPRHLGWRLVEVVRQVRVLQYPTAAQGMRRFWRRAETGVPQTALAPPAQG